MFQSNPLNSKRLLQARSTESVRGLLDSGDRTDWYQFRLKRAGQLNLKIKELSPSVSGDARVVLFDRSGQTIQRLSLRSNGRSRGNNAAEAAMSARLKAGTFFVRVAASRGSQTAYRLRLAIAQIPPQPETNPSGSPVADAGITLPTNSPALPPSDSGTNLSPTPAPTVSLKRNQGLNTIRGNRLRITDSLLEASSTQQSDANQLVYTLTRLPHNAVLKRNGQPLGLGDRFTQQDIVDGALEYRSTAPNANLTELFRSSTAQSVYARGISDQSVVFVVEEYDPVRDMTDADLFLHNGWATSKIADNLVSQAGRVTGVGYSIFVQDIENSAVLFAVDQGGTAEDLYLYHAGTLQQLADNVRSARGIADGERIIGSNAIWTEQRFLWQDNRPIPDDRIYATDIGSGETIRLAEASEFDQFVGFTDWGWVWTGTGGADGGTDREIFLYDDRTGETRQLTQNGVNEREVRIAGSIVTWGTDQPSDPLLFYDGSMTGTIPAPSGNRNAIVGLSDKQILWSTQAMSQITTDYYAYDIASGRSTLLIDSFIFSSGRSPSIQWAVSGDQVFWKENRPNAEIFFYDATMQQICQVTDESTTNDRLFAASPDGLLITSDDAAAPQLYFFDSQTATLTRLSEPDTKNTAINSGQNFLSGLADPQNAKAVTWFSQNPESGSLFNGKTLLYNRATRSIVQLSSNFSPTQISGSKVAFNTTELKADPQASNPPIQEQVLYLYRAPEFCRCGGPMQDSFGFTLTDGIGGAIEGSFALQTL